MKARNSLVLALVALFLWSGDVAAQAAAEEEKKPSGIFSLFVENDVFAGLDSGYTNGVRFIWVSPRLDDAAKSPRVPRWLDTMSRRLPFPRSKESQRFLSLRLGQSIYTPVDLECRDLIIEDRPYAGFAYAGLGFHVMNESTMDTLEIEAGIVGPHSFAGDIQKLWHKLFGWRYPNGWEHQLRDEPALSIAYDRKWKVRRPADTKALTWDVISHAGAALSNVITGATSGIELRAGWRIPKDFGTTLIQEGSASASLFEERDRRATGRDPLGFHVFIALEGHAVLRNLFLDGNTFRDSHRVAKNPFTADLMAGFALHYRRFKFSFAYIVQTMQFNTQKNYPVYGALNLSLVLID